MFICPTKVPYKISPCQIMLLFFETLFPYVAVELIPYTWLLQNTFPSIKHSTSSQGLKYLSEEFVNILQGMR